MKPAAYDGTSTSGTQPWKYDRNWRYFRFDDDNKVSYKYILSIKFVEVVDICQQFRTFFYLQTDLLLIRSCRLSCTRACLCLLGLQFSQYAIVIARQVVHWWCAGH